MRGWSLSRLTPVDSAEKRDMLPPPKMGSRAMVKHMMPSPPIHWVSTRQNSVPCDSFSTLSTMEKPVVVNPDIVSKKASVSVGISLLVM